MVLYTLRPLYNPVYYSMILDKARISAGPQMTIFDYLLYIYSFYGGDPIKDGTF